MRPLLRDASIKPTPADIAWTRDAFRDLLRIRASSSLFHLQGAREVQARLDFPNTGPEQEPAVMVAHLEGRGLAGARFAEVVVLVNVDVRAHSLALPTLKDKAFELHPVHTAPRAADPRPAREARYEAASGRFDVPPRTAVVFVQP
jgi:hypothetical protein